MWKNNKIWACGTRIHVIFFFFSKCLAMPTLINVYIFVFFFRLVNVKSFSCSYMFTVLFYASVVYIDVFLYFVRAIHTLLKKAYCWLRSEGLQFDWFEPPTIMINIWRNYGYLTHHLRDIFCCHLRHHHLAFSMTNSDELCITKGYLRESEGWRMNEIKHSVRIYINSFTIRAE